MTEDILSKQNMLLELLPVKVAHAHYQLQPAWSESIWANTQSDKNCKNLSPFYT